MLSESPGTPGCIEKSYFDCKSTTTFSAPSCSYIYRYHTDRVCMLGVERRLREQNERQRSKYFDVCVYEYVQSISERTSNVRRKRNESIIVKISSPELA